MARHRLSAARVDATLSAVQLSKVRPIKAGLTRATREVYRRELVPERLHTCRIDVKPIQHIQLGRKASA